MFLGISVYECLISLLRRVWRYYVVLEFKFKGSEPMKTKNLSV